MQTCWMVVMIPMIPFWEEWRWQLCNFTEFFTVLLPGLRGASRQAS